MGRTLHPCGHQRIERELTQGNVLRGSLKLISFLLHTLKR